MKTKLFVAAALAAVSVGYAAAQAKTVVDVAVGSKDHTTLVAAVKAAGLVETLSGKLKLSALTHPQGLQADGADLALVQVEVVDGQGRRHRCPWLHVTLPTS